MRTRLLRRPIPVPRILMAADIFPKNGHPVYLASATSAFTWLEAALAERDPFLGSLLVFPAYDTIRDHPEFKRLVRELKLASS